MNLKILAQTIIRYNFSNVKRLFVITFQMSTIIRYNFLNEPLIGQQQKNSSQRILDWVGTWYAKAQIYELLIVYNDIIISFTIFRRMDAVCRHSRI